MNKKHVLRIEIALLITILGLAYIYISKAFKKPLTYINAIDKVYNSNIHGIAVCLSKADNLKGGNAEPIFSVAGNKDENFSAHSKEGVKLWEAKQLFLSIKLLYGLLFMKM